MEPMVTREEGELVPKGWSVTETGSSWYFRNRYHEDEYLLIRVKKTENPITTVEIVRRDG